MYRHIYVNLDLFRVIPPIGVKVENFENFNYDVLDALTYIRELEKSAPKPITEPLNEDLQQLLNKQPARIPKRRLSPISFQTGKTSDYMDESDPEIQFLCGRVSESSSSSEDDSEQSKQNESQSKQNANDEHQDECEDEEPDYRKILPQWCRDAIDNESADERERNEMGHYEDFMAYSYESVCSPYHGYRNVQRYVMNDVPYKN